MIQRLFPGLVVLAALTGSASQGQEVPQKLPERIPPPASAPQAIEAPPPCCPTVEKTICTRKVYLLEEQTATTLPRLTLRDVEVCHEKQTNLQIDWKETRYVCTELTVEPVVSEQEVVCLTVKPETTIDPCTGKPCTVYKQVPEVKKVQVTVMKAVPREKEYILRTPCLKPVEREVVVQRLAVDATTIPAVTTRLHAVTVPCEVKVQVPVCPPPCITHGCLPQ
jgi:hypothetical protein